MQINKQVYDRIKSMIERERQDIDYEIRANKRAMANIVEKQTVLKRERAKLTELLRGMG